MSSQEKSVKFTGDSSGLEATMSKIRSAGTSAYSGLSTESEKYNKSLENQKLKLSEIVDEAHKYSTSSKEQIRYINDLAKAIETKNRNQYAEKVSSINSTRDKNLDFIDTQIENKGLKGRSADEFRKSQSQLVNEGAKFQKENARREYEEARLQTNYLRQIPDAVKNAAKEQIVESKKTGETLENAAEKLEASSDPKNKIAANIINEQASKDDIKQSKIDREKDKDSFLSSMIKFSYIENAFGALKTAGQSQNAYDLIKPSIQIAGALTGNLVQTAAEAAADFFLDGDKAKAVGRKVGQLGGKVVEGFFGLSAEVIQRNFDAQQGVYRNYNKSKAITGNGFNVQDLSALGYDFETVAGASGDIAKQYGSSRNLTRNVNANYALERGYGLNSSQLSPIIEIQRNTNKDLTSTVTGILSAGKNSYFAGGDRTFLGEFTQKFGQLQKELLKGSSKVSDITTYDILSGFNNVGGQFSTTDFRSMSNISSIQNSLANPSSEAFKAMAFSALRKNNPNASLFDIQSEMEKGYESDNYFQTVMEMVNGLGGSDDYKKFSLQGIFGLSAAATNDLFNGKGKIGKFGKGEFGFNEGSGLMSEAVSNTAQIDSNAAEIKNSFVLGATEGIIEIGERFLEVIAEAFKGSKIEMQNGSLTIGSQTKGQVNILKKGK